GGAAGAAAAPSAPFAYRPALPGYRYAFPRDHGAHEAYRTEWWYYTGHLEASGGRRFGFQVTFFRLGLRDQVNPANPSRWRPDNLYFAHVALSDLTGRRFRFWHRTSRAGPGLAGAAEGRYEVFVGDWRAWLAADGRTHRLAVAVPAPRVGVPPELALDLSLVPAKPPVIHGRDGVSQKAEGPGRASHYYSLTRLRVSGTLAASGPPRPVTGQAWMDHEFGSNQLTEAQVGWDWLSLQLDDGSELMLYRLRLRDGGTEPASSGTLVRPDGSWEHLPLTAFRLTPLGTWTSPASGARYPVRWRVEVPAHGIDLLVEPLLEDQELRTEGLVGVTYWEGAVAARGRPAGGRGYLELTGYAEPLELF
ncbi:MAG TPA: lipocalin-like domain-containing protein, partial [Thermodesulfobacteriota bacterium]|nr:lipocalin-like domain-containing protein [Thermodesulfobacteriota bacterium]